MKKIILTSFAAAAVLAFTVSCASTPKDSASADNTQTEKTEKNTKTAKKIKVINTENQAKKEETPESLYIKKIEGITLTASSFPKETTAGRAFSAPFVFKAVKKDGSPAAGLDIAINYPEAKTDGKTAFGLANLTTDENGTVTFVPAVPSTSFNSEISAYPAGDITNAVIAQEASKSSARASYKVRTNLGQAGGTIAIVDFTSEGKPITNNSVSSSNLLMALMKLGFKRVGNADFTNAVLKDDTQAVYKSAKALLGNNSAWLVFGTVKYAGPVKQTEDGKYTLTLDGVITCLNMKDGTILYETKRSATVKEDKEWNCLPKARTELAESFAKELNYGL